MKAQSSPLAEETDRSPERAWAPSSHRRRLAARPPPISRLRRRAEALLHNKIARTSSGPCARRGAEAPAYLCWRIKSRHQQRRMTVLAAEMSWRTEGIRPPFEASARLGRPVFRGLLLAASRST